MKFELNKIYLGDCIEVMQGFDENSIDSIVTDSPYLLNFMGKAWDSTGISFNIDVWAECLRVLKPGGHILSFGGGRTYHRMVCAIEDAGFEIRDTLQWIFAQGFPKSLDISKSIDKMKGAKREIIGKEKHPTSKDRTGNKSPYQAENNHLNANFNLTAPATPEAKQWDGWGTGLKPACEMICLARKPLSEKNVALNVLKWGTGGININGCRIDGQPHHNYGRTSSGSAFAGKSNIPINTPDKGRFPSNVLLNEEAAELLDEQSGERKAGGKVKGHEPSRTGDRGIYSKWGRVENKPFYDKGGGSRFFYVAKSSKSERNAGLEGFEYGEPPKTGRSKPAPGRKSALGAPRQNSHPTVKPVKLLRFLVRLITPPGGVCLDPFTGSGTTPIACIIEGFDYIGIEKEKEYFDIAEKRIFHYKREGRLF